MLGAIFGDITGSIYEFHPIKTKDFPLKNPKSHFTDDTAMTLAVAKALMESWGKSDEEIHKELVKSMQVIGRAFPHAGYGGRFFRWLKEDNPRPYNSWGNGSAMRVSPVGWLYNDLEKTLHVAKLTAEVTHNHPEGIKGAQATAAGIFLARTGADKETIKKYIEGTFEYNLSHSLNQIRPRYTFDVSCQGSVPESIISFLEADSYEDTIRNAISLGGDSDTMACIAGGIAEAYYGMPEEFKQDALDKLPESLRKITEEFREFYLKVSGKLEDGWKHDVTLRNISDQHFM